MIAHKNKYWIIYTIDWKDNLFFFTREKSIILYFVPLLGCLLSLFNAYFYLLLKLIIYSSSIKFIRY